MLHVLASNAAMTLHPSTQVPRLQEALRRQLFFAYGGSLSFPVGVVPPVSLERLYRSTGPDPFECRRRGVEHMSLSDLSGAPSLLGRGSQASASNASLTGCRRPPPCACSISRK